MSDSAPIYDQSGVTVYQGDALETLKGLPAGSVHMVVTSPPYWGLRDYGTAQWEGGDEGCDHKPDIDHTASVAAKSTLVGTKQEHASECRTNYRDVCGKCGARRIDSQLGLEATPEEFIANMVEVFREVWRVLRDDGTLWLNMGDSYAQGPSGSTRNKISDGTGGNTSWQHDRGWSTVAPSLKPKDLCGIPWRLALALQADGWYLRSASPWVKRSAMPESVTDRPASALEYMFLLAKSTRYYFDMEAIKKMAAYAGESRGGSTNRYEQNNAGMDNKEYSTCNFRNSDLWFESIDTPHGIVTLEDEIVGFDVNPAAYKKAHFATFSPRLVEPCILSGTSNEGVCPECGKPWERVVEKQYVKSPVHGDGSVVGRHYKTGANNFDGSGMPRLNKETTTTGWRPACFCFHHPGHTKPVPATVLDPFMGSGTTAEGAKYNGRHCVGIELNAEYCQLIPERLEQHVLF